jgi:hypothetical protein
MDSKNIIRKRPFAFIMFILSIMAENLFAPTVCVAANSGKR